MTPNLDGLLGGADGWLGRVTSSLGRWLMTSWGRMVVGDVRGVGFRWVVGRLTDASVLGKFWWLWSERLDDLVGRFKKSEIGFRERDVAGTRLLPNES